MAEALRNLVRARAADSCEYCRVSSDIAGLLPFHVDHVRPKQHRGTDELSNLSYSCSWCNRFKGPNVTSYDPETDALVILFNPRTDHWHEHFWLDGAVIVGRTPQGRATVELLRMNDEKRLGLRIELADAGGL
jgi:hypothetical protein